MKISKYLNYKIKCEKFKNIFIILFIMGGLFTLWANKTIAAQSKPFVSNNVREIPDDYVGLVLGTSKFMPDGRQNVYFNLRISAASKLYHDGKVKYFIVSGDNKHYSYNEPEQMKNDLVKEGIPESFIYLDYAGFRTLDSVVRAKKVFGLSKVVFVSQRFHNERAVYLARQNNIDAYGFNAQDVSKHSGFKTNVREIIARDKVFVDLILGVSPKFLGEAVIIPTQE